MKKHLSFPGQSEIAYNASFSLAIEALCFFRFIYTVFRQKKNIYFLIYAFPTHALGKSNTDLLHRFHESLLLF